MVRMAGCAAGPALAALLLAGCADSGPKPPVYGWGGYEDLVYAMYAEPGSATPEVQIDQLSAGIEQARSAGHQAGPGVYAHLGYMHYLNGNIGAARSAFEQERTLYPESTVFMDRMLKQMGEG